MTGGGIVLISIAWRSRGNGQCGNRRSSGGWKARSEMTAAAAKNEAARRHAAKTSRQTFAVSAK